MSNIPSEKRYLLKNGFILNEKYEIQGVLGEGGFGITYIGENRQIGLKTAIKEFFCREYMDRDSRESGEVFLLSEDQKERFQKEKKRFLDEARTLSRFASEKEIVHVNDFFEANGTCYIVMPFLDGVTLKEYVKKNGRLESEDFFKKMKPLLKTLAKLHNGGVVHRDISPDNIMMLEDGSLCLIDFGGAVDFTEEAKSYGVLCKRGYAAPEQYKKQELPGPSADIYALSATMYFCLTGLDPEDSLQRILFDELQMPKTLGISLPEEIESMLQKGLELRKESRWQSVDEMLDVIGRVYADLPEVKEERKSRKKIILFIVIAAAVIILAVSGFLIYRSLSVEQRLQNTDTTGIWLETNEEMSVQDYNRASDVIRGRLEAFAGNNNYLFEEDDSGIRMELPVSCLEGEDPAEICREYISRPMELYVASLDSVEGSLEDIREEAVALPREQILNIEKKHGECEGADREALDLPETGDYYYQLLSVSEEEAKLINDSLSNALESPGNQFCLIFDIFQDNYQNYYYLNCISTEDAETFAVMTDRQKGRYPDLLYYDLTHEASANGFGVYAEPIVVWEQVASADITGKNQTDTEEITGNYALLQYSFATSEDEQKADWYHNMVAFKERLDALQKPYAVGSLPYDGSAVVVKINTEGLFREKLIMLSTPWDTLYVSSVWDLPAGNISLDVQNLVLDEENRLVAALESYKQEELLSELESLQKDSVNTVYLTCELSEISLASAETGKLLEEVRQGSAVFPDLSFDVDSGFFDFIKVCFSEELVNRAYLDKIVVYEEETKKPEFPEIDDMPLLCQPPVPDQTDFLQRLEQDIAEQGGTMTFERAMSGEYQVKFWFFDAAPESLAAGLLSFVEESVKKNEVQLNTGAFRSWNYYYSTESFPDPDRIRLVTGIEKSEDERRMVLSGTLHNNSAEENETIQKDVNTYLQGSPVLQSLLPKDTDHIQVQ